jgi:hypothetical protein
MLVHGEMHVPAGFWEFLPGEIFLVTVAGEEHSGRGNWAAKCGAAGVLWNNEFVA